MKTSPVYLEEIQKYVCKTCKHFRMVERPYNHCVKINVREGWGDYTYMAVKCTDTCLKWENRNATSPSISNGTAPIS